MDWVSSGERRGVWQKEQGWSPSSAQMILPQDRQFGTAAKRGWMEALQVHLRGVLEEASEGFVVSSRAEMAEVRSDMDEVVAVLPPREGDDEAELWP